MKGKRMMMVTALAGSMALPTMAQDKVEATLGSDFVSSYVWRGQKNGGFNVRDGQLIVSADNRVIFRCNIEEMSVSELMSLEGVIITAPDIESGGKVRTIICYYVYYR